MCRRFRRCSVTSMKRRFAHAHAFDLLVVAMFVAAELTAIADPVSEGSRVAQFLLPAAWTLPLLARRRAPVVSVLAVLAAFALTSQLAQPASASITVLPPAIAAFWVAGTIQDRAVAVATWAVAVLLTFVVVAENPGPFGVSDAFFVAIFTTAPFAAGIAFGSRARRAEELERQAAELERTRSEQARAAVEEERARIARELHDVVGHAISVMMVQAGGARLGLASEPAKAREALLAVEDAGRDALGEMRHALEMLREADGDGSLDPQPGLADLDSLVARSREAGLDVTVTVDGERRGV